MAATTNDKIDLKGWMTQAQYSKKHNVKLSTVSRWVKRAKEKEGTPYIQFLEVPALGVTLVKPI